MALAHLADEYFRNLNPTASKIYADIEEAKSSYQHLWESLTEKEKEAVINESLIKPEIALKYGLEESLDFDLDDLPCFRKDDLMSFFGKDHGRRVVQDENGSYRDEHSAPFLYQTKSQLNLCALADCRLKKDENPNSLVLSHCKVVSELKNALKSHDVLKSNKEKYENSPKHEEISSPSSFISKFMGNMKQKTKENDKERLVHSNPNSQQDTSLMATFKNALSPNMEHKQEKDYTSYKNTNTKVDLDEKCRLLSSSVSHASSSTGFNSCEDIGSRTDSTEILTAQGLPRTGYDFLDNW